MARINFLVPVFHAHKFTGGFWCVMEYAAGLAGRGHTVRVVPILPSRAPRWFPRPFGELVTARPRSTLSAIARATASAAVGGATLNKARLRASLAEALFQTLLLKPFLLPIEIRSGVGIAYVARTAPAADIHVATSMDTARPTALLPHGKGFYFVQHLETLFRNEYPNPAWAELEARQSYHLGLRMIATSPWLQHQLTTESGVADIPLCSNGINHDVFVGTPKPATREKRIVVISYGGRDAEWKGFAEMCQAVAAARASLPDYEIVWQVYGPALLPPDNPVASYEPLGFLQPGPLAEAYRRADILLSASWYESFPFFPIEAMACGLAVITSQPGTEAYAIPGETAEVVEPRNPARLTRALVRLIQDPDYRAALAAAGKRRSREFTWPRAVATLEAILLGG
jgi:glycosyltransferase involved in cell wall biosynthesis